jgi:hypothetical protein
MKNVLWLVVGFAAGVIAAQRIAKTPAGKAFFDDVESRVQDFSETVVDEYRSREAELRTMLADFGAADATPGPTDSTSAATATPTASPTATASSSATPSASPAS